MAYILKFTLPCTFVLVFLFKGMDSKIRVLPPLQEKEMHSRSLQNHFLGVHDVCLSEVDMVNQFSEGNSSKKKRLLYSAPMPPRLSGLQLLLKV